MLDVSPKESATNFIFANNMAQSKLFNLFNLYSVAIVGLLFSVIEFLVGYGDKDFTIEVIAFMQAFSGLCGLFFAIWASQTPKERQVQNTFLYISGMLFEVAIFVTSLVNFSSFLYQSDIPGLYFLIPILSFVITFFLLYIFSMHKSQNFTSTHARTASFGGFIVIFIVGMFIAEMINTSSADFVHSLTDYAQGMLMIGAGSVANLILGLLTGFNFAKNLLVKRYDIDISRLYGSND
ncbi:MAG: hypothetical protein LBC43_02095 [Bifidobacteriaceae bacterium]|jgi:hypothetical protein|nr:hypothetical protein [Bifidobacteriaceae bacterium]